MRRRLLFVLLVLNGLLLPLSCIPALFLVNSVNPMQLVFITKFTVENRTAATVYVTPVGVLETRPGRCPLPLELWQAPSVPATKRARLPVRSGESVTFHYDWDDVRLSELVVESDDGELRQLVIDSGAHVRHFVLDDLDRLDPVSPVVREGYDAAQKPLRFWPIVVVTSAPAVSFALLLRGYKRIGRRPDRELKKEKGQADAHV